MHVKRREASRPPTNELALGATFPPASLGGPT